MNGGSPTCARIASRAASEATSPSVWTTDFGATVKPGKFFGNSEQATTFPWRESCGAAAFRSVEDELTRSELLLTGFLQQSDSSLSGASFRQAISDSTGAFAEEMSCDAAIVLLLQWASAASFSQHRAQPKPFNHNNRVMIAALKIFL
jgi:hypothetical protein